MLTRGSVVAESVPHDARWIYYSVDADALQAFLGALAHVLDMRRIQPRLPACGPGGCALATPAHAPTRGREEA